MYKFFTTIGDEVNVSVTFSHTPAEPMTHDHPGVDEEVEIESVLIDDCESKNVNDSLSEETWHRLYEECETWTERQDEPVKELEFVETEHLGIMTANGIKGQYFINVGAWSHLDILTVSTSGPVLVRLDHFCTLEEAVEAATRFDLAKDDE